MRSIWGRESRLSPRDKLCAAIDTDVAVIGGGMAGLLTARLLTERGIACVVLEGRRCGGGQTGHTTAKITAQHGLIYRRLTDKFGVATATQYAQAATHALREYARLVEAGGIDCRFERLPAYLYTRSERAVLEAERDAARAAALDMTLCTPHALPFEASALRLDHQAQFSPLHFLEAISEGLTVYEQSPVCAVENGTIFTDDGTVRAQRVVIATHFPFINAPGYYFIRMYQQRSYVLALENAPLPDGIYYGVDAGNRSIRGAAPYLLLGGGGHRTGESAEGGGYEALRRTAREWYPQAREVACWSAQDCMTLDGLPYIGEYSPSLPNVYVATGFNKWGMSGAMTAALCLADLLTDKPHPYPLFSPHRFRLAADLTALISQSV